MFKAHRRLHHSTLGLRVFKKRRRSTPPITGGVRFAVAFSAARLIDSCITQLKAQGPSRTCNESKEEEKNITLGRSFDCNMTPSFCARSWSRVPGSGLEMSDIKVYEP